MPKNPTDPQQTTDVQELLESSEAFNPNVGVTIAPMSDNTHRRQHSNISKKKPVTFYTFITFLHEAVEILINSKC